MHSRTKWNNIFTVTEKKVNLSIYNSTLSKNTFQKKKIKIYLFTYTKKKKKNDERIYSLLNVFYLNYQVEAKLNQKQNFIHSPDRRAKEIIAAQLTMKDIFLIF